MRRRGPNLASINQFISRLISRVRPGLLARCRDASATVNDAIDSYVVDRAELAAAGLAFFTLLSIAPLIIIAVAVAGSLLGQGTARQEALRLVGETMGADAAVAVTGWVEQAAESGGLASVAGFGFMLYAASRLGAQLRVALNQVWNVDERLAESFKATIHDYVKRRLFAFLMVLAAGPLLLVVFVSRALLTKLQELVIATTPANGLVVQLGQVVFSLISVAVVTALVFRTVPDTRVGWGPIKRGAMMTSLLFNAGNWLVGMYLERAAVAEAYGAAGSVVVVLLWLYFSAQMFLFGAELTQAYARRHGSGLSDAEAEELARAESQGRVRTARRPMESQ